MSRQRLVAFIAAAVVATTALVSILFWLRLPSRLPTDADYEKANELIASQLKPGDIIVLAPFWAQRGRQFLTAAPTYAGYDLEGDKYPGTHRQWLVALADAPRVSLSEIRETLLGRGSSAGAGQRIGGLWVEPFAIEGPKSLYSFLDHADDALVTIGGSRNEVCRDLPRGLHQCSHGDWNRVQAGWHEMDERPVHCVWAHPVGQDPVQITYRDVPIPAGSHFTGWGAFVGQAAATPNGAPVKMDVQVEGQPATSVTFDNRFGKQPFEQSLSQGAEKATVTLSVTTPNAGMRHFCFDAWIQPPG
jgi:hypothetical protein